MSCSAMTLRESCLLTWRYSENSWVEMRKYKTLEGVHVCRRVLYLRASGLVCLDVVRLRDYRSSKRIYPFKQPPLSIDE
ncbi:hypothetical protein EYF80_026345 [Liparis tanakae]|uniref:Uncharacterized protein n=1 Tax=Liparis tanakae TaxID=230148 RepID=A0A4Z2HDZ9_9TELE|nr:hypothetical protein EYF80_026345 [Liparis tanakae]